MERKIKIVAAIQARLGSKRLPDKVLLNLHGKPVIEHIARRLMRAKELDQVIVATTTEAKDDRLADVVRGLGIDCVRGSERNLVQRLLKVAEECGADGVVRITGDSPLIDSVSVDHAVTEFRKRFGKISFITTGLPPSFPEGLNFEIISKETLQYLDRSLTSAEDREAFIIYISTRPQKFPRHNVNYNRDATDIRLSLDYPEDFLLIEEIYSHFRKRGQEFFGLDEILEFLDKNQKMVEVNQHHLDKSKYPYNLGPEAVRKGL